MTLRQPAHRLEVVGKGNLRVLDSVSRCYIGLSGDLEVDGAIEDTGIYIDDDLEVLGPVPMGNWDLHCSNAVLRSGLSTAADVECDRLEVMHRLESTGELTAESLRCAGKLKATQIEIVGDITIVG